MSDDLLVKLKALQHQRNDMSPFATHNEFLVWSDSVLPLLSFNPSLQNQFKSAVRAANTNRSLGVPDGTNANIGRAIGLLNQAVISREVNPVPSAATQPSSDQSNSEDDWYKKPIGLMGVGVLIVVLGVLAVYLLKIYTGLPL